MIYIYIYILSKKKWCTIRWQESSAVNINITHVTNNWNHSSKCLWTNKVTYQDTSYDCDFWYTCVKWWYLQQIFHFVKSWLLEFVGGKRGKNDVKLPISVCFALYLRNCRSHHQDFDNDIYRCFSLYFF